MVTENQAVMRDTHGRAFQDHYMAGLTLPFPSLVSVGADDGGRRWSARSSIPI
jgi:hypothetical protein